MANHVVTKKLAHVDNVSVYFDFGYPIRQLIHRVKFDRDIAGARLLGVLAVRRFQPLASTVGSATLCPVPLARARMLTRGFNQAVELCLPVGRQLSLSVDVVSVYKLRSGLTQSKLNASTRRENTRGAFALRAPLNFEMAIIFDDVITTGAGRVDYCRREINFMCLGS